MKKVNKGTGCLRIFILLIFIVIIIVSIKHGLKPKKGETVKQSVCNFLGVFDKTKETTSGATGILDKGNGTYNITYNYYPFSAEGGQKMDEEIGIKLTDSLKDLFKADERIEKIGIFVKVPYVSGDRNAGLVYKPFKSFMVDREVVNCIDDEIRFKSELIKWSKDINEIKE